MTVPNAQADPQGQPQGRIQVPAAPVLVAGLELSAWLTVDGEILCQETEQAAETARKQPPILCHARATARRLGCVVEATDVKSLRHGSDCQLHHRFRSVLPLRWGLNTVPPRSRHRPCPGTRQLLTQEESHDPFHIDRTLHSRPWCPFRRARGQTLRSRSSNDW